MSPRANKATTRSRATTKPAPLTGDTERRDLSTLNPSPVNVRIHSERQIAELKRSVEQFGQIRPLVIDEEGTIWAGNGLFRALFEMGRKDALVLVVKGLTDTQKRKLMLADNKIFELANNDLTAELEILRGLGEYDVPGYDADILEQMAASGSGIDKLITDYGANAVPRDGGGTETERCETCGQPLRLKNPGVT